MCRRNILQIYNKQTRIKNYTWLYQGRDCEDYCLGSGTVQSDNHRAFHNVLRDYKTFITSKPNDLSQRICSQPQENRKKDFFFDNQRCSTCAPRVTRHTSIRYSSSSAFNGRPLGFCSHRHPVSVNCLYHPRMVLFVGRYFAYFARNTRCTVTTDLLV